MEFRELTKSTISFSWGMSLFGFSQLINSLQPRKAAGSFDTVTRATERELGSALKATFRVGDNLQRGFVDLMFNILTLQIFFPSGPQRAAGSQGAKSPSSQQPTGWGPVDPAGSD